MPRFEGKTRRSTTTPSCPTTTRTGGRRRNPERLAPHRSPVGRLNALRVFRDSTDMAANPDLWGKVTDAMDRSRYLIVVLSSQAVGL